jgi:hypothetical protein
VQALLLRVDKVQMKVLVLVYPTVILSESSMGSLMEQWKVSEKDMSMARSTAMLMAVAMADPREQY